MKDAFLAVRRYNTLCLRADRGAPIRSASAVWHAMANRLFSAAQDLEDADAPKSRVRFVRDRAVDARQRAVTEGRLYSASLEHARNVRRGSASR